MISMMLGFVIGWLIALALPMVVDWWCGRKHKTRKDRYTNPWNK